MPHVHHMVARQQGLHLGDLFDHGAAFAPLGGLGEGVRRARPGVGDSPEVAVHQVPGPPGVGVPSDDHRQLARVVMAVVVHQAILQAQVVQILVPADHRPLVGVLGVGGGEQLLFHQTQGTVHAPKFALADYYLQLRGEGVVVQLQVQQAIRLQLEAQLQVLGGQVFEVRGIIPGGEGVDLPAPGLEDAGELFGSRVSVPGTSGVRRGGRCR